MSTRNQFLAWDQADKKMRTILLLALVTVARCDQDDCARSVSVALSRQEPQLAVAPDVGGASGPFVRQKIGVSVSWAHVRALLEQNCVHAFLVEYGEESKNQPKSRLQKRESVALNAKISPPFTNGENEFTAELPEDCTVSNNVAEKKGRHGHFSLRAGLLLPTGRTLAGSRQRGPPFAPSPVLACRPPRRRRRILRRHRHQPCPGVRHGHGRLAIEDLQA